MALSDKMTFAELEVKYASLTPEERREIDALLTNHRKGLRQIKEDFNIPEELIDDPLEWCRQAMLLSIHNPMDVVVQEVANFRDSVGARVTTRSSRKVVCAECITPVKCLEASGPTITKSCPECERITAHVSIMTLI